MIQINIDMKMPERCGLCRFTSAMDCGITGKFIENHDEIPSHCPLKEVPTGKWSDINNSLPIVGMNVLVCDEDGDIYLTHRSYGGVFFNEYGDKIKDIRAWMPLPEPYKMVEEWE